LPDFVIAICLGCIFSHFSIFVLIPLNAIKKTNGAISIPQPEIKSLDYRRTANPRDYQISNRTPTKASTVYKTQHDQTASSILCRISHSNNKGDQNISPIISR